VISERAKSGTMAPRGNSGKQKQGGLGHYILGKTIGEGTLGKVKLGTHILTGETVAVKILERERIKEIADVERVAREIHILKRVQHPHIIQLYEIIETPHHLFLIMEYCSGGELFDHIVECGRVPEGDACRFFQQILSGVEQIHRINVVHRDLKPENLLLDQDKNIKIVDFGLSNIYKDDQLLKTACGSPCYASPEMIAAHWYVPSRCDVWSCGVILFALVCGYLPFEDGNTAALYRKILNAEYRTPKFISQSVQGLIGKMLTTDPEKRITIPEIREHPWYKQIPDAAAIWDGKAKDKELRQDIMKQLDGLGFPRDFAVQSLKNQKHNMVTTTYYLLLEKMRRRALRDAKRGEIKVSEPDSSESTNSNDEEGDTQAASPRRPMNRSRRKKNLQKGDGKESNAANEGADTSTGNADGNRRQRNRRGRGGRQSQRQRQDAGQHAVS
jgi:5'-AMP-activated protein kinase catalytic alpha subunit